MIHNNYFHFHPPLHAAIYPAERVVSGRVPGITALPALCTNPNFDPLFSFFRRTIRKGVEKGTLLRRNQYTKKGTASAPV